MAQVTLVIGQTYTIRNRTFLKDQPLNITAPEDLEYFRANAHFSVTADPPKPLRKAVVAPPKVVEPEEEEVVEEEPETAVEEEEQPQEVEEAPLEEQEPEPEPEPVVEEPEPVPVVKKVAAKQPRKGQFQKGGKRA